MRIQLSDIGKKYGQHWIFRALSGQFDLGHVYPITGANGSGKSTLLQVISGFVTPNEGQINYSLANEEFVGIEKRFKHISLATPYLDLFEELNVQETIQLHHRLKPLRKTEQDLLQELELENHKNKPLKQLSSGMKQRLKLALAIHSETEVLLLDEPLSNLDQKWSEWYDFNIAQTKSKRITIIASNDHPVELKHADKESIQLSAT